MRVDKRNKFGLGSHRVVGFWAGISRTCLDEASVKKAGIRHCDTAQTCVHGLDFQVDSLCHGQPGILTFRRKIHQVRLGGRYDTPSGLTQSNLRPCCAQFSHFTGRAASLDCVVADHADDSIHALNLHPNRDTCHLSMRSVSRGTEWARPTTSTGGSSGDHVDHQDEGKKKRGKRNGSCH